MLERNGDSIVVIAYIAPPNLDDKYTMLNYTKYTVEYLRELLRDVPDDAKVQIYFETCVGDAVKEESPGYDESDNTFTIGTS